MRRIVEEADVLGALDSGMEEGRVRKASGPLRRKLIRGAVEEVLEAAPNADEAPLPPLVGLAEAAAILGIKKQHITRLMAQGALVPAERFASGPIFRRSDVEAEQKRLDESRRAREERRREKESTDA